MSNIPRRRPPAQPVRSHLDRSGLDFRLRRGVSGCVLVILTVGAGRAAGSGKMLMRAVSFFGPACAPEPG